MLSSRCCLIFVLSFVLLFLESLNLLITEERCWALFSRSMYTLHTICLLYSYRLQINGIKKNYGNCWSLNLCPLYHRLICSMSALEAKFVSVRWASVADVVYRGAEVFVIKNIYLNNILLWNPLHIKTLIAFNMSVYACTIFHSINALVIMCTEFLLLFKRHKHFSRVCLLLSLLVLVL
jgi:hypothetical protein